MNFLALLATIAIPIAAILFLRSYRKSFHSARRSSTNSSSGWNEVVQEARRLRAAKTAGAAAPALQPGPDKRKLP